MQTLKKIWNVVSTVLVVLVVLCAVFLMGTRLMGYEVYTIITGSMEPVYSVGDLVYVHRIYTEDINAIKDQAERSAAIQKKIAAVQDMVDSGELKVGDAITFVLNEDLVVATHRIVQIDEENKKIYTKGDANETVDSPLRYENIIGPVKFSIPMLGYVSNFIQNPPGTYITIAAGAVLVILVFLPDFLPKKKEEDSTAAPVDAQDQAILDENEKLKAELEALKAQLAKTDEPAGE